MKLYTEEQVAKMLGRARLHSHDDSEMFTDEYLISCETPIELPSDDDIEFRTSYFKFEKNKQIFYNGAKWVINHIKQQ